jgi:hypothetical protein
MKPGLRGSSDLCLEGLRLKKKKMLPDLIAQLFVHLHNKLCNIVRFIALKTNED